MVELSIVQLLLRWMWCSAEKDHGSAMALVECLRDWCLMVLLALGPWPCLDKIGTLYVCTAQALAVKQNRLPFPQTLDDLVDVSVDQIKAAELQRSLWGIRHAPDASTIKLAGTHVHSILFDLLSYYLVDEAGDGGRKTPIAHFLDECLFWCDSVLAILDAPCPPGADGGEDVKGAHNEATKACVQ